MKKFFGSYGWSVILGALAGFLTTKGMKDLGLLLILPAMINAMYLEFKANATKTKKTISVLIALILSPVLFQVSANVVYKLITQA